MSEMESKESFERVYHGLKKAASCARQLGLAQMDPGWTKLGNVLDDMLSNCQKIYTGGVLSRASALAIVDQRQKNLNVKLNGEV